MLATHVSSVGQLQYDAGRDFVITRDSAGVATIMPLGYDAQGAFKLLQTNINRIRAEFKLAPLPVDSVLDGKVLDAIIAIAQNPTNITAVTQPTMIDMKTDTTYQSYMLLAPFRKIVDRNAALEDLATKARLWTVVLGGIADNTWLGSQEIQNGIVTFDPPTKKSIVLPVVLATIGGLTLGGIVGVAVWHRTR